MPTALFVNAGSYFSHADPSYGLADHSIEEVLDFYSSREEAEETLMQILQDEPDWAGTLEVVEVELGSASATRPIHS